MLRSLILFFLLLIVLSQFFLYDLIEVWSPLDLDCDSYFLYHSTLMVSLDIIHWHWNTIILDSLEGPIFLKLHKTSYINYLGTSLTQGLESNLINSIHEVVSYNFEVMFRLLLESNRHHVTRKLFKWFKVSSNILR